MGFVLASWPSNEALECVSVFVNFMAVGCFMFLMMLIFVGWGTSFKKKSPGSGTASLLSTFIHSVHHWQLPVLGCMAHSQPWTLSPTLPCYSHQLSSGYTTVFWLLHFSFYCSTLIEMLCLWGKSSPHHPCLHFSFFALNSENTWLWSLVWHLFSLSTASYLFKIIYFLLICIYFGGTCDNFIHSYNV